MKLLARQFSTLTILFMTAPAMAFPKALAGKTIEDVITSNLQFVASEQVQAETPLFNKGEWSTNIYSTLVPVLVGVGKLIGHNKESSAFSTGGVANTLASMYLENEKWQNHPEFKKIPKMVSDAVTSFEKFREGDLYNFYPPRQWKGVRVHQPIDMSLASPWKGLTNVPEDSDTTSTVYATKIYDALLNGKNYRVPGSVLESLQKFRDVDRKAHMYNRMYDRRLTGAFLTWQMDENSPIMPRFWFADPKKGPRIPFNRNDVDCIVNANVLRMLALNKTPDVPGRAEACATLNDMIKQNESATCGIYYPNTFNLAYSIAKVEKAGGACLQPDRKIDLVDLILKNQSADGGWDNVNNIWIDRLQSTVFAMEALMDLGDLNDRGVAASLRYGARFLLDSMKVSKGGHLYLEGETFFTATAVARSLIVWKSDAYTTALGASALVKFATYFPEYTAEYLEKMN